MQVILLFLLTSLAFGETLQCSPEQLEKECYNQLCSATHERPVPTDPEELKKALEKFPYTLPGEIEQDFEKLARVSDGIKAGTQKFLDKNGASKVAEDLLETPVESMYVMRSLYEGELGCLQDKLPCRLYANDLGLHSEGMKTLFKKWSDSTFIYREGLTLPIEERKEILLKMLEEMEPHLTQDQVKAEKRKISSMGSELHYMVLMESEWLSEYQKKMASELRPFVKHLEESLQNRMQELLSLEISGEKAKAKLKESCQLATFVKSAIDKETTPQKFNEMRLNVIDTIKNKFFPKLSNHSAKLLSKNLNPEMIQMIEGEVHVHPVRPYIGAYGIKYVPPQNGLNLLKDLILLRQGREHRCSLGGLFPKDSFNFSKEEIQLSKFILANGHGDALVHELGHWLSFQLKKKKMSDESRKKLLKVRKCVRGFYSWDKRKSVFALRYYNDHFNTEEDFADWFSAVAGNGERGLQCDLKNMMTSFYGSKEAGLYLPYKGDPHSNYLFRELNVRIQRGQSVPQSCRDLMEVHSGMAPKKCDF